MAFILLANLLKNNAKKVWRTPTHFAIFIVSLSVVAVFGGKCALQLFEGFLVVPDRELIQSREPRRSK